LKLHDIRDQPLQQEDHHRINKIIEDWCDWYVSNVSIIFDTPCLFLHHLPCVSLHFVAFLCDFRN
jgi:hypothetical protein